MARFSQIAKGAAARKRGVRFNALDGTECVCDLRILTGEDDDKIIEVAVARAVDKKATPKKGDPVYDFACACEAVARGAVDPDSPESAPVPFFASADEVRQNLDRDRIAYLFELQYSFQEETSPLKRDLTTEEYQKKIIEIVAAEADDVSPFEGYGRSTLISWLRTTALAFATSAMHRLASGGNAPSDLSKATSSTSADSSASPPASSDTKH